MSWRDIIQFISQELLRHRFRTAVLWIAIAIGVIAINLLTALGAGAKTYVLDQFNVLGRNTLIILPGKKETTGGMPPLTGESPRPLTVKDARAVLRLSGINEVAPLSLGNIEVSHGGKIREVMLLGTSRSFFSIRQLELAQGKLLPLLEFDKAQAVCVIGSQLRKELFSNKPALGEWVRAGDTRFRVVGVLKEKGTGMGFDMDEVMMVPVANAQSVFNVEGLFRLFVEVKYYQQLDTIKQQITELLTQRHEGEEDVTVVSQDALLTSLQGILDALTLAVAGIASISMLVASILIMNMMLITISQRTREIGLLKALGATESMVRVLFLSEAGLIAFVAAFSGLLLSYGLLFIANLFFEDIQFHTPWWAQLGSLILSILLAIIFAWLPAQRAASLAPVEALQGKQQRVQG